MFRHSLKLIYRNFLRFKSTFFINLIGLSTGLACAILIFLWVNDELMFDKFHEKDERLYQVWERWEYTDRIGIEDGTAGLLAEALVAEMPEVEYAATVIPASWNPNLTLTVGDKSIRAAGQSVGKDYFNIFSFDLIDGDRNSVLADKNAIVISEDLALKLFGTLEGVVGRVIKFQHHEQYTVSGIFKNIPSHSSLEFDFVLSYERGIKESNPWLLDWSSSGPETYLTLKEGADAAQFNKKISHFLISKGEGPHRTLFIKPFSENYLYNKYENGQQAGGSIEYVKLFSAIALFILLIACINFMNLSTAKATRRIKEIGIKKVIGTNRRVLIGQYLGESLLMAFLSLLVAVFLVVLLLPHFNNITGKQLNLEPDLYLVAAVLGITFFTGLIAGIYPAFYLSGFKPLDALKGGAFSSKSNGGEVLWARKSLVVFQFTLSIILMVAVVVVSKQIDYVQSKDLGYNKENIIYFNKEGAIARKLDTFLPALSRIPGVTIASSISESLVGRNSSIEDLEWEGKEPDEMIEFEKIEVNWGMMEMLDIRMSAGRFFSEDHRADSTNIILNEAAVRAMGITEPLGKTVKLWGEERMIIGITNDFHFESLHEKVKPVLFIASPENTSRIMAKIEAGTEKETIAKIQQLYMRYNPGFPFDFNFLDEDYQAQYEAEQRVSVLSRYFAGLAILISCLGLYGLVAFAAEQRRKEIGIRKVLGASVANIMTLLSKDFIKLVSISIIVGCLLSWLAMSRWLEGFAYRIEMGWWMFILAATAALLIALCTVSVQALKAARANPVKNLRTE